VRLVFFSLPSCISDRTIGLSAAETKDLIQSVHDAYAAALQRGSGTKLCHPSSIHILNGSTAVPPPVSRSNLTSFGQYRCWDTKVWMIKSRCSIADQILAGSSGTVTVRQRKNEDAHTALMHIGLIAGTPVRPKFAFSITLLEFFYHLRRRQPSIGVQGFVKASCALQQVRFPLSMHPQTTNHLYY
jgi:hypothetical protein